jgi:hypothetical protein
MRVLAFQDGMPCRLMQMTAIIAPWMMILMKIILGFLNWRKNNRQFQ